MTDNKVRKRGTLTKTDLHTLKLFFEVIRSEKKTFRKTLLVFVASVAFTVVTPFALSAILAGLVQPDVNIKPFVVLFIVSSAVGVLANRVGFIALMKQASSSAETMRKKVYRMLLKRSMGYFNDKVSGKIISDAIDFPRSFTNLNGIIFIDIIPFLLTAIIGLAVITVQDISLGIIMFFMTVFMILWALIYSYVHSNERAVRKDAQRKLAAFTGDTITNILTVKSTANERTEISTFEKLSAKLQDLQENDWVKVAKDGSNRHMVLILLQFVFILYLISSVRNNPEAIAVSIFAFSYSLTIIAKMFQVGQIIRQLDEAFLEAAPMSTLLQTDYRIKDKPNAQKLTVTSAEISLENVSFSYPDNQQAVFENFNLKLKSHKRLGLVGPSGGGKSTLMKLLLRFEDIDSGLIAIDGQNISSVTQDSLRSQIAYVPQEPLLFHRTIKENILYGTERATMSQVKSAAKDAYALDFINNLQNGFDTVVGERGVKLSGGQKQRIALARAILRDAPILLLDEATSALDSESEQYIQKALHKLMKSKTVIVIAHRLSTINELDEIVVIENGVITEQGTHRHLLAKKGTYSELWKHQSGGFLED